MNDQIKKEAVWEYSTFWRVLLFSVLSVHMRRKGCTCGIERDE
jgi:hypothetical protein